MTGSPSAAGRLFLVGPRGSGKTTVAALVAERLGWAWIDADVVIEQRAGCSIKAIFAREGEPGFRARERDVLRDLCGVDRTVIATGGGVVLHPDNREQLRQSGLVVWLTAEVDVLWQRIAADASTAERRPALGVGGREEVAKTAAAREPLYRESAHFAVDTGAKTPAEAALAVLAFVRDRQARRDNEQ